MNTNDRLEKIFENIDKRFDRFESKMDSHFRWILGSIFAMIFTTITLFGVIIHLEKLI